MSLILALSPVMIFSLCGNEFYLYRNKQPQAVIVASKTDKQKLQGVVTEFNAELQKHGVPALPYGQKSVAGKGTVQLVLNNEPSPLKKFEFVIEFPAKDVMKITGNSNLAINFAFNHILDKYAGRCIFLSKSVVVKGELNDYPAIKDLKIPAEKFSDGPACPIRFSVAKGIQWNMGSIYWGGHFLGAFAFPVKKYYDNNSWPEEIMPTLSNGVKFKMPVPKKKLKEIFKGKNLPKEAAEAFYCRLIATMFNPCWSAKATEDIAVKNIMEAIAKRPELKCFMIDINDLGQCKCKKCLAVVNAKRNTVNLANYSDLYWKWVKNVAERINKKYPHIMFVGMAYREVTDPPSFKLPSTVIVCICFELAQMADKEAARRRRNLMDGWSKKCDYICVYGYGHGGLDNYFLPRMYPVLHDSVLKEFYSKYNMKGYHHESYSAVTSINGPENYVINTLLWNPKADVKKILDGWYEGMVGRKAAPYLKEYYQFWEQYWTGDRIRKTGWFGSNKAIYCMLGDHTHIFALKKGDMAYCRNLLNKVLANAETPAQKKRAELLSKEFESSELAAKALFAELVEPDGSVKDAETACELIKALPDATESMKKFLAHPAIKTIGRKGNVYRRIESLQLLSFMSVIPFISEPTVAAEFKKLKNTKWLSETLKACIRFFDKKNLMVNKYPNSSFEDTKKVQKHFYRHMKDSKVIHTTEVAHTGKYSMKLSNGWYSFHVDALPGEKYLAVAWIYTNKPSSEGKLTYRLGPCHWDKTTGPHFLSWFRVDDMKVPAGRWIPLMIAGDVPLNATRGGGKGNRIYLYLEVKNYEDDEFIFVDDISFIKL